MIEPSLDELLDKAGNVYTLVIVAAKRARQLTEGEPRLVETDSLQDVSVALREYNQGKIKHERPRRKGPK